MSEIKRICLLPGDGIGPEITDEAVKVLNVISERFGARFEYDEALLGGIAIDETGSPLPDETLESARAADAVLLAAIGGPKWDTHRSGQAAARAGASRHAQGA